MLATLRKQLSLYSAPIQTGILLGLGYVFVLLIGIPSDDSPQLAELALPIYLIIGFIVAWLRARQHDTLSRIIPNSLLIGLFAGVVMLLFLSMVNNWHAQGIAVTRLYFDNLNTYPIHILSGIPEEELEPNPARDPITDAAQGQLRTNPVSLYIGEDYSTFAGVPVGGLYGMALWLILGTLAGGLGQYTSSHVDWAQVRGRYRRSYQANHQLVSAVHWFQILLPVLIFALFWLTVAHRTNDDSFRVIDLRSTFNLTSGSLVSQESLQLGLSFLIVITGILGVRRVVPTPSPLAYGVRVGLNLLVILPLIGVALWRVDSENLQVLTPSIFQDFDAGLASSAGEFWTLLLVVLLGAGMVAAIVIGNRRSERYQLVFAATLALTLLLIAPLYMNQSQTFIMGRVGLAVMLGLGLSITVGYAGLLDLGYVAFYAIGAYTFAFLALETDRNLIGRSQLNNIGWMALSGVIVAPLLIFLSAMAWDRTRGEKKHRDTLLKTQKPLWGKQPPIVVTLVIVLSAIVLTYGVQALLNEAGIFEVYEVSSFLIAIVVTLIVSAIVGAILGFPVLRLRGDYLAIVTLGFGEIISLYMLNADTITGGPLGVIGVPKPTTSGTGIATGNLILLYLSILGAGLVVLVSLRLRNSRLGRAWLAMHSDEDIAQAMGINLVNTKLLAFMFGASFAGLGGLLFASRQNSIFPGDFGLEVSINALALVIIGGMGSIPGVIVGSIVLVGVPEMLRPIEEYRIMAFGLLLILTMIVRPEGLLPAPPPALEDEARRLAEAENGSNDDHA